MSTPTIEPPKVEATAAPAPEKPADPTPTAEEIEASVAEFKATFYSGEDLRTRQARAKKKPTPAPKAEDTIVIEDPAPADPPAEPVVPPPAEPKPPAKVVVPPPPSLLAAPVNDEDLTTRLAASVAERLKIPATPEPPKPTEREQKLAAVFDEMAKIDPVYIGLGAKIKASKQAEAAHIARWTSENPGQQFDPESEEHDEFYKRNTVDYDQSDFAMAVEQITSRSAEQIADSIVEKKFKQREQQQRAQQEIHTIAGVVSNSVTDFIERAEPAFKDVITVNGTKTLSPEVEAKMEEADPVALMVLKEECEPMAAMIQELEQLARLGDAYQLDMNKTIPLRNKRAYFQPVRAALDIVTALEDEMLKLPPEETMRGARRLVSNTEFSNHLQSITTSRLTQEQKNAEQKRFLASYYHLDSNDFRDGIIAQSVAEAQARIKKIRGAVGSRSASVPAVVPQAGKQATPPPVQKSQQTPSPRPPATVVASSDIVNTRKPVAIDDEDPLTIIRKRSFGQ